MRSFTSSSGATKASQVGSACAAAALAVRPSASSVSTAGVTCPGSSSPKRGSPEKSSSGLDTVLQKHGYGHGPDAAGHRGNGAGDFLYRFEIHVADKLAVGAAVHAYVDHAGSRFDHGRRDQFRPSDRGDEHVGCFRQLGQIVGLRMTDGDARILLQEEERDRLADDVGAAHDD